MAMPAGAVVAGTHAQGAILRDAGSSPAPRSDAAVAEALDAEIGMIFRTMLRDRRNREHPDPDLRSQARMFASFGRSELRILLRIRRAGRRAV